MKISLRVAFGSPFLFAVGSAAGFPTRKITCYFSASASPRQTYINGMAKKNEKIWQEAEPGPTYHTIEQTEFEEIVRETLKAQEASLNAMKLISKAL